MSLCNPAAADFPLFCAVLRPSRSLAARGLFVLMGLFAGVSAVSGVAFLWMGAWPVSGFFGVDVLLLYWAFRVNNRDGRAYEMVTVTPSELIVQQVSARGAVRQWTLNPLWVRLDRETIEDFGTHRLFVVSHGRRVAIATVLGPQEKDGFATALSAALASARRGH